MDTLITELWWRQYCDGVVREHNNFTHIIRITQRFALVVVMILLLSSVLKLEFLFNSLLFNYLDAEIQRENSNNGNLDNYGDDDVDNDNDNNQDSSPSILIYFTFVSHLIHIFRTRCRFSIDFKYSLNTSAITRLFCSPLQFQVQ